MDFPSSADSTIRSNQPRQGVTLVELLVTMFILALLLALLLPAIQSARESARRTACANNLKQLTLAVIQYEGSFRQFPPAYAYVPGRHNYVNYILPFLEESEMNEKLDFNRNYDAWPNTLVTQTDLPMMVCPSSPDLRVGRWKGDYATATSISLDFHDDLVNANVITQRVTMERSRRGRQRSLLNMLQNRRAASGDVLDGLSNSMMLFEDAGRPSRYLRHRRVPGSSSGSRWADPTSYFVIHQSQCGLTQVVNCSNNNEIYSFHTQGANFSYGDGSIRFHDEGIDIDVFVSLFTRSASD